MSDSMKLNLILKATDGLSSVVKSACEQSDKAFDDLNKKLEDTSKKFEDAGKKAAVFGGALVGISAANLKFAGDFEQGMNNVSTLIDTNSENLGEMSDEILKMAKNSPKAINDLTDGLYSIRSAGISAEEQFNVLHGSEMLAVSGLASTSEAVDIATSAINAFNLKGDEANKIYDMFFKVVKYGKTNVSQFAQGFGSVAGVVASAGIQLDEYSASIAAMTTSGVQASIAHTQVKAAIAGLSRGSKEQMEVFNKLGVKSFAQLVKKSGGMVNAFGKINKAVGGNQSKLIQLVGSVEAYNAILSLTGANNKVYRQTLEDMRNGGDSLSEAYAKQTDGLNNQMAIIKNNFQALSIEFGTALVPVIKAAGKAIKGVSNVLSSMPDGLKSFVAIATAGIGVVSLFGGTTMMMTGGIIKNFIFLRKVMRTASILSWANPAMLPIAGVTLAIAGLAAGAVYCYKKFEGFRNICQGIWAVIKAGGAWLAVLWQSFATCAMQVWDFIAPAVKFGATIFGWISPIGWVIKGIQKLCGWIGSLIEKAGGFAQIGKDWKKWGEEKTAEFENQNAEIKQNRQIDGSHSNGLDYVPFDGYRAEVHKGEAILTKDEANYWRNSKTNNYSSSSLPITIEYRPQITFAPTTSNEQKEEFMSLLRSHADEIVRIINNSTRRQTARAY